MIFILSKNFQKKSSLLHTHFIFHSWRNKKKGGRWGETNQSSSSARPEVLWISDGVQSRSWISQVRACRLGQGCRVGCLMRSYHTMWRDGPPPPPRHPPTNTATIKLGCTRYSNLLFSLLLATISSSCINFYVSNVVIVEGVFLFLA